ncbi:MAG TPA: NAD(P)/FAD-dependent oxidoreductase [Bryobacteraceae bacterium]|nr:NAD(P)/FAD-dependent oxidoreductase [Bryobacteraceae bacterium]
MHSCDVLIVGAGPAGSSCAWKLVRAGFDVAIADRARFPRDKVCGGWITPEVLSRREIEAYEGVLQPITSFRVGVIGGRSVQIHYGKPVSYGIRRREFDDYLLKRSGARVFEGTALETLERDRDAWIVNASIRSRIVIGAGGHFCPVARKMGAKMTDAVVAQESEFEMTPAQIAQCQVHGDTPELYFSRDLLGYGWCFRKGDILNVGLGRADPSRLADHVHEFVRWKVPFEIPAPHGHAYLLYGSSPRKTYGDGWMLIGDAAGLAYPFSGEGILPAIESGLIAAKVIANREPFSSYPPRLEKHFGTPSTWLTSIGAKFPRRFLADHVVPTQWFARDVVLGRWFLHS